MYFDGLEDMAGVMTRRSASNRDLNTTEGTSETAAITSGIDIDMELTRLRDRGGDDEEGRRCDQAECGVFHGWP